MDGETTEDSVEILEGQTYPGWQAPFEDSFLKITEDGLHLLTSIPFPRPVDLDDFRILTGYRVFADRFPLIIWKFGRNFLLPAPCNPAFERLHNLREVDFFFERRPVGFSRALIDGRGIIRVLEETDLEKDFVTRLCELWAEPKTDWTGYNDWLLFTFKTGTHILWEKALGCQISVRRPE